MYDVLINKVCVSQQSWQEVVSKANEHMTHSVVSVKVTSDISALCNASNDMGTEIKAFSIKASESLFYLHWKVCTSGSCCGFDEDCTDICIQTMEIRVILFFIF